MVRNLLIYIRLRTTRGKVLQDIIDNSQTEQGNQDQPLLQSE